MARNGGGARGRPAGAPPNKPCCHGPQVSAPITASMRFFIVIASKGLMM